ncbi:MAG: GTP cyclohydrolase, FolE2/MptA family [Nocardioides sp.]
MLPDIQDETDARGIELNEVGISGLRYPIEFVDGQIAQGGVAEFEVIVRLPADRRGTHMSRMIELTHDHLQRFDPRDLPVVLKNFAAKLEVDVCEVRTSFPLAIEVKSPVSERTSWQAGDLRFEAAINEGIFQSAMAMTTQVTSLCPCSKAISDYGAHNQRSDVTLQVFADGDDPYPLSAMSAFEFIRSVGSCPVFPIVKRSDERAITMTAFDHPAFVEDMARDLSTAMRTLNLPHRVSVKNLESIHSHDAVARLAWL